MSTKRGSHLVAIFFVALPIVQHVIYSTRLDLPAARNVEAGLFLTLVYTTFPGLDAGCMGGIGGPEEKK